MHLLENTVLWNICSRPAWQQRTHNSETDPESVHLTRFQVETSDPSLHSYSRPGAAARTACRTPRASASTIVVPSGPPAAILLQNPKLRRACNIRGQECIGFCSGLGNQGASASSAAAGGGQRADSVLPPLLLTHLSAYCCLLGAKDCYKPEVVCATRQESSEPAQWTWACSPLPPIPRAAAVPLKCTALKCTAFALSQ